MKLSCNVYRDLMLMLEDGLCSEDSRRLVEEHLAECEDCRKFYAGMHLPQEMAGEMNPEIPGETGQDAPAGTSRGITEGTGQDTPAGTSQDTTGKTEQCAPAGTNWDAAGEDIPAEPNPQALAEKEALRKSFRKIKRRWLLSLVLLVLLLPLSWLGRMFINQIRGEGTCFSNLDEIYFAGRFLELMQDGNYEKAVEMIDFEGKYLDLIKALNMEGTKQYEDCFREVYGNVQEMTVEEFAARERAEFLDYIKSHGGENGSWISGYHYKNALFYPNSGEWEIYYEVKEPAEGTRYEEEIPWTFGLRFSKEGKFWENASRFDPILLENLGDADLSNSPALHGLFSFQGDRLSRLINGLE